MMKRLGTLAGATALALLSGCTSWVTITSQPSGAEVRIDGKRIGRTPVRTEVRWKGGKDNIIRLTHRDCYVFETVMRRTPYVELIGAGALGGPVGLGAAIANCMGPVKKQHFILAPRDRARNSRSNPASRVAHILKGTKP
jgi:hypothetical protein